MGRHFHGPAVADACNPQVDVIPAVWDADECAADVLEILRRIVGQGVALAGRQRPQAGAGDGIPVAGPVGPVTGPMGSSTGSTSAMAGPAGDSMDRGLLSMGLGGEPEGDSEAVGPPGSIGRTPRRDLRLRRASGRCRRIWMPTNKNV